MPKVAEACRSLQQTEMGLLCWESHLVPSRRQRLACRERVHNGSPIPCMPLNNGSLLQRQITLPLGAFPVLELLTLISPGYLLTVNCNPLPRSSLLFPHLAPSPCQHLQTLVSEWAIPGLTPQEVLERVAYGPWRAKLCLGLRW